MDYKKLGLKCGLEIHQQLDTAKLFCSCPSNLRDDKPDILVKRKLRAVAGETGDIDVAALMEMMKNKYFVYEGYSDSTCLVEFDEEPPHPMNKEALNVALQISLMLKAKAVDEIQVMRKTVVDGSNTAGFQRTALVARNGILETAEGKITIPTICIEEDAARKISEDPSSINWRLDRLGIPLVEIATGPEIHSPQQCKEAAEKLGMFLRSTGKAKRGIGTIRQDINISIAGHPRVEVKGEQDLKLIPKIVELEAQRQKNILEITKELRERKLSRIKLEIIDLSKILGKSESKLIKSTLEKKGKILAQKLAGFSGILGKETLPDKRFGTELSERAKVAGGVGGLFHSDEALKKYGFRDSELDEIKKALNLKYNDAFVIIADNESRARKALEAVVERANLALEGGVKEVRKPNADATTSFMRPMPGAARMYPETDIPSITPDTGKIKLPELISEKAERIEEYGIGKDLADMLSKSGKTEFFEACIGKFKNLKPAFIAELLLTTEKNLRRNFNLDVRISEDVFENIFEALDKRKIAKEALQDIFVDYAKKNKLDLKNYEAMSDKELEAELKRIIAESKGADMRLIISRAMSRLRGKADAKKIMEKIKELS